MRQIICNFDVWWTLVDQKGPESPASCWCSARCWTPSGPIEVVVFLWHHKMDSNRGKVGPKYDIPYRLALPSPKARYISYLLGDHPS